MHSTSAQPVSANISETYILTPGRSQLVVSMPHVGTFIPEELKGCFVPRALEVEDTDWHLPQLYDFASAMGATILQARLSRYVIDLNRPPDNAPMYPGASNTELCPTRFFTGDSIYHDSLAPDAKEQARRLKLYWQPYHDQLAATLAEVRSQHGRALLWDAHSIRQEIPWLFEGRLAGLNLGTAQAKSCALTLRQKLTEVLERSQVIAPEFTSVVDGRFKGGYTTRHYGEPASHVHVAQMEMAQALYMDEVAPFRYAPARAEKIKPVLRSLLQAMLDWKPN
jgi:N-formylglutamate deformylase